MNAPVKFYIPEIIFGDGAMTEAGYAAGRLGARRVFVVTDPGLIEAGWVAELAGYLHDSGIPFVVWHGVTPNPKDYEVAAGYEAYAESGCDVIIGLGGGSVIDAAKAIAVLATNGGSILDYEGVDRVKAAIPPLIMIPSTAGTGADVSQFCVITDTSRRLKATLIGRALVPDLSITDPRLLSTMPHALRAATGLDALTHGIEAFVSRAASVLTDTHALEAVALVSGNLLRTIELPRDPTHRAAMARASLGAGVAFTNAILGATHAMSHQVGGALDLPHGVVNGVLLPHVIRFNAVLNAGRLRPVALALGLEVVGKPDDVVAEETADAVRSLTEAVGVPRTLSELGVTAQDIPRLAANTLLDACLTTNPRDATVEDISAVFHAAL